MAGLVGSRVDGLANELLRAFGSSRFGRTLCLERVSGEAIPGWVSSCANVGHNVHDRQTVQKPDLESPAKEIRRSES